MSVRYSVYNFAAATADNTPFDGQPMQGRVLGLWKGGVRVD